MKNYYLPFFLFLSSVMHVNAQWTSTPSPDVVYRYDDVYFLNPSVGWAINYASNTHDGMVIKTIDGAQSWQTVLDGSGAAFRDIGFTDSLHGWIGTLQHGENPEDTIIMYQTIDGGMNWSPVENLPGPSPAGICGMCVVNDSTVYACGRYFGPAGFYKTTNNGQSWSYTDMSAYAGGLVDIHFFSPDSGFVVGTSGNWSLNNGRVLFTADGGNTWQIKHTSAHQKEICWKISFPSANIGYVSLESFRGTAGQYFLKTIDGGMTWQDMSFTNSATYDSEGIGFINDNVGWIGGGTLNYKTIDGGLTWTTDDWGVHVNRFRFFPDGSGFAAGEAIYKLEDGSVSIEENDLADNVKIYPNPFISQISIAVEKDNWQQAIFIIRNLVGQIMFSDQQHNIGENFTKTIDLNSFSKGIYMVEVMIDGERTVKKMVKD